MDRKMNPDSGRLRLRYGRRLQDWPDDVVELADALERDRFAVTGVSGGGPYVVARAAKIPHRLTAAAIISGLGPVESPGVTNEMVLYLRLLVRTARHSASAVRLLWHMAHGVGGRDGERIRYLEASWMPITERCVLGSAEVS